ncbi:hypothetical protein F2Q69_00023850 [Brassica cretica]|uniref:Uncharacterized protein n=1 Tax=Brassica cretica TaxID=69181 RepID=A0A8S9QD58_BRACR|nr:hypothetical protein F2Q69_00023850 [Brassica cretica]
MAYSFILLADLKACCCSNTAEVCLLRFMEAQNVKNLSDPWLRRHQNQRLTEPFVVFFHVVPHGLGKAKIISKLILLWELLRIYVEMLFINKQMTPLLEKAIRSAMLLIRFIEMGDISGTMAGALSTAKEPRA